MGQLGPAINDKKFFTARLAEVGWQEINEILTALWAHRDAVDELGGYPAFQVIGAIGVRAVHISEERIGYGSARINTDEKSKQDADERG